MLLETGEIASSSETNSVIARMHAGASSAESASSAAMASLVVLCCAVPCRNLPGDLA